MEKAFKFLTIAITGSLLASVVLHILLYTSDSEMFRYWVTIQISLQIAGSVSLVFMLRYSQLALYSFAIISISFAVINAKYVNYGDNEMHVALFLLFWIIYGTLLFKVRKKFVAYQ